VSNEILLHPGKQEFHNTGKIGSLETLNFLTGSAGSIRL
jgi:hypothetical protein